ncbi:hypothetical protein [Rhodococcus phage REQ1]|uniref:hypothetical protein n=1 Tax=Rhodococcus phage REQ1 TaxID=1109712 RepID=UPI00023EEC63|nr:hypothetical protein RoPhREQ1_gp65 [Rhodococcus phage REQ1]AEV52061.1 hypothetical protein [Rhodococcus phage REQ1]
MSDEMTAEQSALVREVQSGDMRRALTAIRDYVVHELDGNRCPKCAMSQLKTGDTASLVLRLQKILEEIAALPEEKKPGEDDAPKTGIARIRALRAVGDDEPMGSKASPRTQGGPRRRS